MAEKKCLECKEKLNIRTMKYPSQQKIENAKKFCSSVHARQYGLKKSWKENKAGRIKAIQDVFDDPVRSKEIKRKMSEWQLGDKGLMWRGNDAAYNSKHRWVQKHFKRTKTCEHCGITPPERTNGASGTEWSNKSGKYDRNDRDDWQELCSKCHKFYDKAFRAGKKLVI